MTRPLEPNGDKMLGHLEEIKACSQEIENIIIKLALRKTTSRAALTEAMVKIHELDRRIKEAADKAEKIRQEDSKRVRAAQEREERKRQSE